MKDISQMEGGVWGIVVIISTFMIQFISFGISGSIGVYNVEFLEYFDTDAMQVSMLSSINLGVFLGTGPIASYLMDRYTHRKVVLVGGLMTSVGVLVMPWLPTIPYMYLFYGVINGLGGCLSYVPSHVLSGLYYDKRRGLATGLATGGSGLGITVGPIVIAYLIDEYTWKGSVLILAGISFNILVFGALLRPPPPTTDTTLVIEARNLPSVAPYVENDTDNGKHSIQVFITDIDNNIPKHVNHEHDERKTCPDVKSPYVSYIECNTRHQNQVPDVQYGTIKSVESLQTPRCINESNQVASDQRRISNDVKELATKPTEQRMKDLTASQKPSYIRKLVNNILTDIDFMIYFLNNILWNTGMSICLAFLAEYFVQHGLSKLDSAFIVTISGFGDFLGCFIGGFLSNIKRLNSFYTYSAANILAGVSLIMIPFVSGYNSYIISSFLFGIFTGIILGYLLAITGDILGPEHFGDGVGVIMISNGLGCFAGPSIAGYLEESYGLGAGLIVGGVACIVGGLVVLFIPLRKYCKKKTANQGCDVKYTNEADASECNTIITVSGMVTVSGVSDTTSPSVRKNSFYKEVSLVDEG